MMTCIRTRLRNWLVPASALLVLASPCGAAGEGNGRSPSPATLAEMAYAAEVAGQTALQAVLVDQVLLQDPGNEKARWLAGQVRCDGAWNSASAVEEDRGKDRLLREYVEKRASCGDDADSRLRLANWCRDHAMPDRERVHLMELATGNGAAAPAVMSRLGMVRFRDQWMPKEAVEEYRQMDDDQRRLEKKWRPTLAKWKDDLATGDQAAWDGLAARLKGTMDAEALPLLEEIISADSKKAALVVVAYLDGQANHAATESLIRHAVFSQFDAVRAAAAESLKKRPKYNYLPILVAGLVAPLEMDVEYPYGNRGYKRTTLVQHGMDYDLKYVDHHASYLTYGQRYLRQGRSNLRTYSGFAAIEPGRYVEHGTERTRRNERISDTLYLLTGERYKTPEEWQNWWRNYTEYEKGGEKPVYEACAYQYQYRFAVSTVPSCLASGTPVATETGSHPVEQILPGDRLLSQDPGTGALAYKVVQQRTVRRLGEMRKISTASDTITVTLGHPFWVVGQGWRMAKELEVGQRIRCLGDSEEITAIEKLPEDVAYNFVVDEFATYFAGASRILLHDNTLPKPTDAVLPGFSARGE